MVIGPDLKYWLMKEYYSKKTPQGAPTLGFPDAISILNEAVECLQKRGEKYNKDNNKAGRERHMQEIVALFNQLTGHNLKPRDGWLFMVCLKMVRAYANGGHDCFVDGAAYFALAGELEK